MSTFVRSAGGAKRAQAAYIAKKNLAAKAKASAQAKAFAAKKKAAASAKPDMKPL